MDVQFSNNKFALHKINLDLDNTKLMIKQILWMTAACLVYLSTTHAALPPFYESKKEIESILHSKNLEEKIGSAEALLSISRNRTGYQITTNSHTLQIDLIYEPQQMPGPAHYRLLFHEKIPVNIQAP